MADLGADLNIKSKKPINYKMEGVQNDNANTSLFKIAYKIGNKDMLSIMMIQSTKTGETMVQEAMRDSDTIQEEVTKAGIGQYLK